MTDFNPGRPARVPTDPRLGCARFAVAAAVVSVLGIVVAPAHGQERHIGKGRHVPLFEAAIKAELEGDRYLEQGRRDRADAAYDRAIAGYQRVITIQRRFLPAFLRLSRVLGVRKQHERAAATLMLAKKSFPEDHRLLDQLGIHLCLAGHARQGVPLLEKVVAKDPGRVAAQELLAAYYLQQKKLPRAVVALKAILGAQPQAHRWRLRLGQAEARLGHFSEAIESFRAVPSAAPEYGRALVGLGVALIEVGKSEEALGILERVREQSRDKGWLAREAALGVARAQLGLGRHKLALAGFRAYLARVKNDPRGYLGGGECLRHLGRYREALAHLEHAVHLYPRSPRVFASIAKTYAGLRDYKNAVASQDQAIRLAPKDWQQRSTLATIYRQQGDAARALALHSELLSKRAWSDELHTQQGHDLYHLDRFTEAEEAYRKALKIAPKQLGARRGLLFLGLRNARALLDEKKLKDARRNLEALQSLDVKRELVYEWLAAVALEEGDLKASEKWLANIPRKKRSRSWLHQLVKGRIHLARRNPRAALSAVEKVDLARLSGFDASAVRTVLATAQMNLQLFEEAISTAKLLVNAGYQLGHTMPLLARSLVGRAEQQWHKKRRAALDDLKAALRHRQHLPPAALKRAFLLRALIEMEMGKKAAAFADIAEYRKVRAGRERDGSSATVEAYIHFRGDQYDRAVGLLDKLASQGTLPAAADKLLRASLREWALQAFGNRAYRRANAIVAKLRARSKRLTPEEEHLIACLQYYAGKKERSAAVQTFKRLVPKVPEAILALGIYSETVGNMAAAMEYYGDYLQRAGSRAPPRMRRWIAIKRRIFGEGGAR